MLQGGFVSAKTDSQMSCYKIKNHYEFCNFKIELNAESIILPDDPRILKRGYYRRDAVIYKEEIIDDKSANFREFGSFMFFIPKEKIPFPTQAKKYVLVRARGAREKSQVARLQKTFLDIKNIAESKKGSKTLVLEPLHPGSKIGNNLELRMAWGHYIDYVGPLKESDMRKPVR